MSGFLDIWISSVGQWITGQYFVSFLRINISKTKNF